MIKNKNFLDAFKFKEISDVIYAETIPANDFQKLNKSKVKNVWELFLEEHRSIKYKLLEFKIYKNSTIFCDTELLNDLFLQLSKVDSNFDLNLITHQSDEMIDSMMFNKKPDCVKKWYSINVETHNKNLHPLPMGLAGSYSKKNLHSKDFPDLNPNKFFNKKSVNLYINFQVNTNFKERAPLLRTFKNKDWANIDPPNNSKSKYLEKLQKHTFVLCPWGNGVDSHRIWETLYAGSIPVVKYHQTFSNLRSLPIFFVDKYEEVNKDNLTNWYKNNDISNFDIQKLDSSWWEKELNKKVVKNDFILLSETDEETNLLSKMYTKKVLNRAKLNKIKTLERRILKFFFYRFLLKKNI
tara:strand:- start:35899 stop:36957 length:1059 start_codon:yes stop_codon:yes gene_type:complete